MQRWKKIIIVAIAIIAVVIIVWLIVAQQRTKSAAVNREQNNAGNNSNNDGTATSQLVPVDNPAAAIEAIARSFAERFGSFSNQSNFENMTDLRPFMTGKMQSWVANYITEAQAKKTAAAPYFGITTQALASKITLLNKASATIDVTTRRRESTAAQADSKIYQQVLELQMVKKDGLWQVDKAEWRQ